MTFEVIEFAVGDLVKVKEETYYGKPVGTFAKVLGTNEIGWVRIIYGQHNVETVPPSFLSLVCKMPAGGIHKKAITR